MSDTPISVRFIEEADIDEVLVCEEKTHVYLDPDFDVPQMPSYAWGKDDLLAAVRQYKSSAKGMNDTRVFVAEILLPTVDESGLKEDAVWVCGALIYEIQPDGYQLLLLTAHPQAPKHVRAALLDKLLAKAQASEKRKRLTMYVPDGDYQNLAFLQKQGWSVKLIPNLSANDEWHCQFEMPTEENSEQHVR